LLRQHRGTGLHDAPDQPGRRRRERDRALHVLAAHATDRWPVRHVPPCRQRARRGPGPMKPRRSRGQESQALIEFALISPVLLLLIFGIIDIGRAIFYYDTLNHAAREGARVAVRASNTMPTDASVLTAVIGQVVGVSVTEPCPQGPISA